MPITRTRQIGKLLLLVISISFLNAGCQSFKTPSLFSRISTQLEAEEEIEYEQPHRMAAIWKETVVAAQPGRKSTRGFGGRVYFYDAGDEPVRVDGELTVYAFDDSQSDPDNPARVPDRKYVFRSGEFQQHFSQTNIGASYSVWIPWDQVGGELTTVSLLPVFKPVDGTIVQAGQSIAVLPGKQSGDFNKVDLQTASIGVRKVNAMLPDGADSQVAQAGGTSTDARRRRPTTISVPRGLGNQLKQINQLYPQTGSSMPRMRNGESSNQSGAADHRIRDYDMDPGERALYERLQAENEETLQTGYRKRPVVFGSPGPVR